MYVIILRTKLLQKRIIRVCYPGQDRTVRAVVIETVFYYGGVQRHTPTVARHDHCHRTEKRPGPVRTGI